MGGTKHIRSDDKKRVKTGVKTPIRRSGCGPGGAAVCWRMAWAVLVAAGGCLPFWGPEMQGERAAPPGRWSAGGGLLGGLLGGCWWSVWDGWGGQ